MNNLFADEDLENANYLGVGYAMVIISSLASVYYNIIMAWTFFYLYDAFRATVRKFKTDFFRSKWWKIVVPF